MKTLLILLVCASGLLTATAQTSQYVTLYAITPTNAPSTNFPVASNQVVSVISLSGTLTLYSYNGYSHTIQVGNTYTGITNLNEYAGMATLLITTPAAAATLTNNYIPADCVVIPASAGGPVQIILESSPDLINWTAASPGLYGPAAGTNRFFRVRALAN